MAEMLRLTPKTRTQCAEDLLRELDELRALVEAGDIDSFLVISCHADGATSFSYPTITGAQLERLVGAATMAIQRIDYDEV